MRFRKRPVEVEAVRWRGGDYAAGPVIEWVLRHGGTARYHEPGERVPGPGRGMTTLGEYIAVDAPTRSMRVLPGEWIVLDRGRFYSYSPEWFEEAYEMVEVERGADAAVDRVRALHHQRPWGTSDIITFGQSVFPDQCDACRGTWPCSTVRALDGDL